MRIKILSSLVCCLVILYSCNQQPKKENTKQTDTSKTVETVVKDSVQNTTSSSESNETDMSPSHYICYNCDTKPNLKMAIAFNASGDALSVQYKGQKESMKLVFVKEDLNDDGAYPVITQYYTEMYNGKENGSYKLTHSGIWDYAVYTRGKDQKVFEFTIDHDITAPDGAYRTTPCY